MANKEIVFIDDEEKKYYTSSDIDECIVYEGKLNDKSHEQIIELILRFVKLFQGASKVEVVDEKIVDESFENYKRKSYIINIQNSYINSGRYEFDNIIICVSH